MDPETMNRLWRFLSHTNRLHPAISPITSSPQYPVSYNDSSWKSKQFSFLFIFYTQKHSAIKPLMLVATAKHTQSQWHTKYINHFMWHNRNKFTRVASCWKIHKCDQLNQKLCIMMKRTKSCKKWDDVDRVKIKRYRISVGTTSICSSHLYRSWHIPQEAEIKKTRFESGNLSDQCSHSLEPGKVIRSRPARNQAT
jgi:hypothetical protein